MNNLNNLGFDRVGDDLEYDNIVGRMIQKFLEKNSTLFDKKHVLDILSEKREKCVHCFYSAAHALNHDLGIVQAGKFQYISCEIHRGFDKMRDYIADYRNPANIPRPKRMDYPFSNFGKWAIIARTEFIKFDDDLWSYAFAHMARVVEGEYEERKHCIVCVKNSEENLVYYLEFSEDMVRIFTKYFTINSYVQAINTCTYGEAEAIQSLDSDPVKFRKIPNCDTCQ